MRKTLLLFFVFLSAVTYAQKKIIPRKAFSAGLDLAFPTNSIYSVGFGGSGKAEVPVAGPVSLTVSAGFTNFYYKTSLFGSAKSQDPSGYLPLKAGVKYYISDGFFIEGESGSVIETNYSKNNLFAFSLSPGFILPINQHTAIEFAFKYENWGNGLVRQTGVRVAYRVNW